ncbi:MAG: hypothetical protein JW990_10660 [Thermoleophilia bacterium]|nr:hypothetical protein [Thermoleophilia bacterium]
MDDKVRALRGTSGYGPLALRSAAAGCLALLSLATLLFVAGCAAPEDLALILQTTDDPLERQKAAVDLAGEHSPALTQRLVSAAENDATAAKGLAALRDEYVLYINGAIEKARAAGKEFNSETELALRDAVDCLALIEDVPSVEALGALVTETERAKAGEPSWRDPTPDTLELQLRALDAVDRAAGGAATVSEAALGQLMDAVLLPGEAISTVAIRDAALTALLEHPEAVDLLFEARVAAADDKDLCSYLDGTLAQAGGPAVDALVGALAEQDWTDEILAEIGAPAVDAVVEELDSGNSRVRFRALGVLLRLFLKDEVSVRDELVRPELVPLLLDARLNATYGDERDRAAEAVLALIGDPAVEPVMALLMKEYWAAGVLASMGEPAVSFLTAALSSEDRDLRFKAADVLVQITKSEPASVAALTAGLADEDLKSIATGYAYYIRLGQAGTEEILAKALHKYGDKDMALDYLNCGNTALDAVAREWAADHGYQVYTEAGTHGGPQWGEGN